MIFRTRQCIVNGQIFFKIRTRWTHCQFKRDSLMVLLDMAAVRIMGIFLTSCWSNVGYIPESHDLKASIITVSRNLGDHEHGRKWYDCCDKGGNPTVTAWPILILSMPFHPISLCHQPYPATMEYQLTII